MRICNDGTLYLNKPLTQGAADIVNEILGEDYARESDLNLDFEEWYETCLDDTIERIIAAIAPDGYVLDGVISCFGDYDGQIRVENNTVQSIDITHVGLYDADDETLIRLLETRGYTVTKKEEAQ